MTLKVLEYELTICRIASLAGIDQNASFFFIGKTDEEISLVCLTKECPVNVTEQEDGWRAFRIQGKLDFSLVGILSKISGILAENNIGIFAVSTYNTDYILVKSEHLEKAITVLMDKGYEII